MKPNTTTQLSSLRYSDRISPLVLQLLQNYQLAANLIEHEPVKTMVNVTRIFPDVPMMEWCKHC